MLGWAPLALAIIMAACGSGSETKPDDGGAGSGGGTGTGVATGTSTGTSTGTGVACGDVKCPMGQVCCDHCTGRCVPSESGALCPDDDEPTRVCPACGHEGEACCPEAGSPKTCGTGLVCCSGVPYPPDGECRPDCPFRSDRNIKTNIEPAPAEEVLERLTSIPITTWSYMDEGPEVRHMGPMAQDFRAAFGLGTSDRRIEGVDANGVSMAAIQALHRSIQKLSDEERALRQENKSLRRALDELGERLKRLETSPSPRRSDRTP
jgi:hypothetical protein